MTEYWIPLQLPSNRLNENFKLIRPIHWSITRFDPKIVLSEELFDWFYSNKLSPLVTVIFQRHYQYQTSYHSDYGSPQPIAAINFQIEGTAIHTFYHIKTDNSTLVSNNAYIAKEYKLEDLELEDTLIMNDDCGYIVKIDVPHHVKATSKFRSLVSIRFREVGGRLLPWQELVDRFVNSV